MKKRTLHIAPLPAPALVLGKRWKRALMLFLLALATVAVLQLLSFSPEPDTAEAGSRDCNDCHNINEYTVEAVVPQQVPEDGSFNYTLVLTNFESGDGNPHDLLDIDLQLEITGESVVLAQGEEAVKTPADMKSSGTMELSWQLNSSSAGPSNLTVSAAATAYRNHNNDKDHDDYRFFKETPLEQVLVRAFPITLSEYALSAEQGTSRNISLSLSSNESIENLSVQVPEAIADMVAVNSSNANWTGSGFSSLGAGESAVLEFDVTALRPVSSTVVLSWLGPGGELESVEISFTITGGQAAAPEEEPYLNKGAALAAYVLTAVFVALVVNRDSGVQHSPRHFWLIVYLLTPLIPLNAYYDASPEKFGSTLESVAIIMGTIAFVWFMNQFIVAARIKFIEKHFGLDWIYRFHGIIAVVAAFLAIFHKLVYEQEVKANITQAGFFLTIGITFFSLIYMGDSLILKLKSVRKLRYDSRGKARLDYQTVKLLHNLTLVGTAILFYHVVTNSVVAANDDLRTVFAAYFIVVVAFYVYHKFLRNLLLKRSPYKVKGVKKESENIWTVTLQPEKGQVFDFKPGQFGFLRVLDGSVKKEEHPFSFSSSPGERSSLSFTIKELGDFTATIPAVKTGESALVDGPYGAFSYAELPEDRQLYLIAGGIGITPLLSMLRTLRDQNPRRQVTLVWCAARQSDIMWQEELEQLKTQMPNFSFHIILSREPEWPGMKGRIDRGKLETIMDEAQAGAEKEFFICGPGGMMKTTVKELRAMGVPSKHIHYENFAF